MCDSLETGPDCNQVIDWNLKSFLQNKRHSITKSDWKTFPQSLKPEGRTSEWKRSQVKKNKNYGAKVRQMPSSVLMIQVQGQHTKEKSTQLCLHWKASVERLLGDWFNSSHFMNGSTFYLFCSVFWSTHYRIPLSCFGDLQCHRLIRVGDFFTEERL